METQILNDSNEIVLTDTFFTENHYMPRPRINRIFEKATHCKLVYVIAGAGYGKTRSVRHYIEQQPGAVVRWMQLTESDNIGSHYWENLTHTVSFDNPDLADRLREFGFPETSARFNRFAEILKGSEHRSFKTFLVLDDFHLIHSEQALAFAQRCAYLQIPGACVIIISRKEPEINIVSLLSKEQVHIITEDELRFTDSEISDYLKRLDVPFSVNDLPKLIDATKGWVLAIQLLALSLKRLPAGFDFAIDTMKQNIFKLMEIEAFNDFPEDIKKSMVKQSLISNLPIAILQKLFDDAALLNQLPRLASFVWYDSLTGEYRANPIYWEFLKSRQFILSEDEKQDTYRQAAKWCSQNNFNLDAVYYFAKLRDFEKVVEILLSYPFKLPYDTCEYFLGVFEDLDLDNEKRGDINVLMLKYLFAPLLLMGMGRYEEAEKLNADVIREWENSNEPISNTLIYTAYSNLAYINVYTCTETHKYNFLKYLKKSIEYFKKSTIPPVEISCSFAVADVRSFACLIGESADLPELDEFEKAVNQTASYIAETSHLMYYGYEDLLSCEIAFLKNRIDIAKNHAYGAILKAREKNQFSIEMMADSYLLRISLYEGNYSITKEILKKMQNHLNNLCFWNRQLLYDLFTGFFYAQIGLPQMAPSWLYADEKDATAELHVPARELIVRVKSYISLKKYAQALVILSNSYPREPKERFLLGELALSLLTAAARIKTGDTPGALKDFEKAYSLSFGGEFEMPFIELGKNLHPLVVEALKQTNFGIPHEWLKTIDRKASIYAKKAAVITNLVNESNKIKDTVQLSEREREVLNDLYHGLSRDEIASNRYLSINTVKKILQSIFIKLDANNNVDAVRIAIERKLIE